MVLRKSLSLAICLLCVATSGLLDANTCSPAAQRLAFPRDLDERPGLAPACDSDTFTHPGFPPASDPTPIPLPPTPTIVPPSGKGLLAWTVADDGAVFVLDSTHALVQLSPGDLAPLARSAPLFGPAEEAPAYLAASESRLLCQQRCHLPDARS